MTLTPLAPKIVLKKSVNLQRVRKLMWLCFFLIHDIVFKEFEDSKSYYDTEHDFDQDHYHKEKIRKIYSSVFDTEER